MYSVESEFSFDSAHFLQGHEGNCRYIHGHRWRVIVELKSNELDNGMIVDFTHLKKELKKIEDRFDHNLIIEANSISHEFSVALQWEGFRRISVSFRPTAENFSKYFYEVLKEIYSDKVYKVSVYETPNNKASYWEEKKQWKDLK